jgi:hypothetical protein
MPDADTVVSRQNSTPIHNNEPVVGNERPGELSAEQVLYEQASGHRPEQTEPSPPTVEREVVIERGVGAALPLAAVGLEYLARKKADRKLDAKFTQTTEELNHKTDAGQQVQEELRSLIDQNKEQLASLKRERLMATGAVNLERKPVTQETRIPEAPRSLERPEFQPKTATPEASKQPEQRKAEIHERQQSLKPEMDSKRIMEQVAAAAEKDVPVEIAFERSHEVKDEPSVAHNAASVAAIIKQQAIEKQRIAKLKAIQAQMGDANQGLPVIHDQASSSMYKQAIRAGFWSAVMIIILGVIAYLMIK